MFLLCYLLYPHLARAYRFLPEVDEHGGAIVSGSHRMTEIKVIQVPYHVLVFYPTLFCSGALIGSKVVLTVASCFSSPDVKVSVKVGTSSVTDPTGQIIPVAKLKLHEYYMYRSPLDNDIALLILQYHVNFGIRVQKVVLVPPDVALRVGTDVEVSGFGSEAIDPRLKLIGTTMVALDLVDCMDRYSGLFTSSMFCVKYGPESLIKDNGGPAVFEKTLLVGIASFDATRVEAPFIAIFTNVSYFNRWIDLNTRRLLQIYCEDHVEVLTESDDDYGIAGAT